MDDDYVLRYIPILTPEGKAAIQKEIEQDEDVIFFNTRLEKDIPLFEGMAAENGFWNKVDSFLKMLPQNTNHEEFKTRLCWLLAILKEMKTYHLDRGNPKSEKGHSYGKDIKQKLKTLETAIERLDCADKYASEIYQETFIEVATEHLNKKYSYPHPDFAKDIAQEVLSFVTNVQPLMLESAKQAQKKKFSAKARSDSIEKNIKEKLARNLALGLYKMLALKAVTTLVTECPINIFDELYRECCLVMGLEKPPSNSLISNQAVAFLNAQIKSG